MKTAIIRSGVVYNGAGKVKLFSGQSTVPKGVSVLLGEGWTKKATGQYVFDVPPGSTFKPLQFAGLQIGGSYNIKFTTVAQTGYGGMLFRPGVLGLDTVINADADYDVDFVAQDSNGITRFLHTDVTGVSRITVAITKFTFTG